MVSIDDRFLAALQAKNIVLICGTGVSAALSGRAPHATWMGLIESALQRAVDLGATSEWDQMVRTNLEFGFKNRNSSAILSAAGLVTAELERHGKNVTAKWLNETVGRLRVVNDSLADALNALPFPILTTNYDTLLETRGRKTAHWGEAAKMQAAITAGDTIGHLHGVWTAPESVIFTEASYRDLMRSDVAQHLEYAASSLKSLVYIGFGAGLDDPNFSKLIEWHAAKFFPSSVPHFRLCLENEVASLAVVHADDHIVPVAYGTSHDDLETFLRSWIPNLGTVALSPTGAARDLVAEARISLGEEIIRDAIIAESRTKDETPTLDDVILPPVLIPVPHSQYVKSRISKDSGDKTARLDPREEVAGADVLVLASDESNGLTTAIKWLALESAKYLGTVVPLYVDFLKCRPGGKPLDEQLRREALLRGIPLGKKDELPPFVLALDDFSPFVPGKSEKVIREIADSSAIFIVIGCAQGTEEEIVEKLTALGRKPVVRYLGRLAAKDVRDLARLAWPTEHENLAKQILEVLSSENLPRTPYTVGLLISVLVRGGVLAKNASETTVLDDYVGLLLGRGDPDDDPRFGLDQPGREAVLAGFAQILVEEIKGGLTEAETVAVFQAVFDKFGWPHSPVGLLTDFLKRHLLRLENGHVSFARSSYLHLFAAKRAIADTAFREHLLSRPLFFTTALTNYAALDRRDGPLVARLANLLDEQEWAHSPSAIFHEITTDGALPRAPQNENSRNTVVKRRDHEDLFFDNQQDLDSPPFPVTDEVDVPASIQLLRILELVSSVLRDTNQSEDLQMKKVVLEKTLTRWGDLMHVLHADHSFRDFVKTIIEDLGVEESERDQALEEFAKAFPAAMSLAGVGHYLASRKLVLVLNNVLATSDISEETIVSATFFIYVLKESGWVQQLQDLLSPRRSIWVIRNFLVRLLISDFINDECSEKDQDALLDLCVNIWQGSTTYQSDADKKAARANLREQWTAQRTTSRARKISSPAASSSA